MNEAYIYTISDDSDLSSSTIANSSKVTTPPISQFMTTSLSICHFNDVYRVTPQKISPTSSDTIDVTQFAALLDTIREGWSIRADGKRDGELRIDNSRILRDMSQQSNNSRPRPVLW